MFCRHHNLNIALWLLRSLIGVGAGRVRRCSLPSFKYNLTFAVKPWSIKAWKYRSPGGICHASLANIGTPVTLQGCQGSLLKGFTGENPCPLSTLKIVSLQAGIVLLAPWSSRISLRLSRGLKAGFPAYSASCPRGRPLASLSSAPFILPRHSLRLLNRPVKAHSL